MMGVGPIPMAVSFHGPFIIPLGKVFLAERGD